MARCKIESSRKLQQFYWPSVFTYLFLTFSGLLVAGTDSKHFLQLTSEVYRFMPSHIKMEDVPRIHGSNERISVKNYEETINFYYRLMLNADKVTL